MFNILNIIGFLWCFSSLAQDTINFKADLYENCWLPEGGLYIEPIWDESEFYETYVVNLVDKKGTLLTNEERHRLIGMRFQVSTFTIDSTFFINGDTIIMKKDSIASCDLKRTYWQDMGTYEIKDANDSSPFTLIDPKLIVEQTSRNILSYKLYMHERIDKETTSPILISVGKIKLRTVYKYNNKKLISWSIVDGKPYKVN